MIDPLTRISGERQMSAVRPFLAPLAAQLLEEAASIIQRGGVLAVPTESFYALAGSACDAGAVARIRALKGRAEDKPFPVLISGTAQLGRFIASMPPAAALLIKAFWPGPLTVILPASSAVPPILLGPGHTVGIREPGHALLRTLLERLGPVTGTSANRSGEPPADSAAGVLAKFGDALDLVLDGGRTAGAPASTIVQTAGSLRLLREGPITRKQMNAVLSQEGMRLEEDS
jgi:L-threonylcarbamoyladenylate synthase